MILSCVTFRSFNFTNIRTQMFVDLYKGTFTLVFSAGSSKKYVSSGLLYNVAFDLQNTFLVM